MSAPPGPPAIIPRPDSFTFLVNRPYAEHVSEAGGRLLQLPTGHWVLYGKHGRRVLLADPDGHPLHECEWQRDADGREALTRARVRLDSGLWVGVKAGGLTTVTTLDLSSKPGWQRLRADDLRDMAARAMRVPLDEVRFFYDDRDLRIDARGLATIRHRKDALYLLEQDRFDGCRFMACMGAMHWNGIDFLPVVELFQSLVPGTGSAVFELIRGLYDDQNAGRSDPRPLRYRGIPTYPSEAAFRLFSTFFTPRAPGGSDPFLLFMDPPRSHEISWWPAPDSPRRYVEDGGRRCIAVQSRTIEKFTDSDDPTGLPYLAPAPGRPAPCERTVHTAHGHVVLVDRGHEIKLPVNPRWGRLEDAITPMPSRPSPVSWSSLFKGQPPRVSPREAFSAVLLYPDDAEEISELPSQPFVMDFIQDLMEQDASLAARIPRARRVLVHRFDAVIGSCIHHAPLPEYTIVYSSERFAQKQAQSLWNQFAAAKRLLDLRRVSMYRAGSEPKDDRPYDLLYEWTPFALFDQPAELERQLTMVNARLAKGATAFISGPGNLPALVHAADLQLEEIQPVHAMASFRMHQSILPQARLKAGLTLYRLHRP